jgi:hypothetical protein
MVFGNIEGIDLPGLGRDGDGKRTVAAPIFHDVRLQSAR